MVRVCASDWLLAPGLPLLLLVARRRDKRLRVDLDTGRWQVWPGARWWPGGGQAQGQICSIHFLYFIFELLSGMGWRQLAVLLLVSVTCCSSAAVLQSGFAGPANGFQGGVS